MWSSNEDLILLTLYLVNFIDQNYPHVAFLPAQIAMLSADKKRELSPT